MINAPPRAIYEFASYRLDLANRRLWLADEEVVPRPKVFDLLAVLFERSGLQAGRMVSYDELLDAVWPESQGASKFDLSVAISELRMIIGKQHIENVPKHGYRWVAQVNLVATAPPLILSSPQSTASVGADDPLLPQASYYVARRTDEDFYRALARGEGLILIKGARQVGKTSLLARGLQRARATGAIVVTTNFQQITGAHCATVDTFLSELAESLAEELQLETRPHQVWRDHLSGGHNFSSYLRRQILTHLPARLIWAMDEVDRLAELPYASQVFGLFRSWHNERSLDPTGPWMRLTMALTYATEAHLFITDLNQSPFNVGTHFFLEDFTRDQVERLNQDHGGRLRDEQEVEQFFNLTGGHPHLTQLGLFEMSYRAVDVATFIARADEEEGVFGSHLRQLLRALKRDAALYDALRAWLLEQCALTAAQFYRLRSAGVLAGHAPADARPRCGLYARYLKQRLS